MESYIVNITETLVKQVEVEANSEEDAVAEVKEQYKKEQHVLDASDFNGVEFSIEQDTE